jgi:uncharacterized Zn finger protein
MTEIRPKALAALRSGRVAITLASLEGQRIQATVESSRPERTTPYIVDRWAGSAVGQWSCTCGNPTDDYCAHIAAVQLVTGHESAARASR